MIIKNVILYIYKLQNHLTMKTPYETTSQRKDFQVILFMFGLLTNMQILRIIKYISIENIQLLILC